MAVSKSWGGSTEGLRAPFKGVWGGYKAGILDPYKNYMDVSVN